MLGPVFMKANSALLSLICVAGLVSILLEKPKAAIAAGIATLAIATLTFLQYVLPFSLGIDQLLITDNWSDTNPGRMAPGTAVNFALAGTLLALHNEYPKKHIIRYDFLITSFLAIPLFAFFSYIFAPEEAIAAPLIGAMPFHEVLNFLFFFFALSLLTNSKGAAGLMNRDTPNGRNFRYLFLLVLILPLCLGSVLSLGVQQEWISTGVGIAIYCLFTTLIVSSALANSAIIQDHWLKKMEQERQRADSLKSRIHELLEISADGIFLVDQNLTILHANSGAERILGYSIAEFLELPMDKLFSENDRNVNTSAIVRFINSSSTQYSYDVPSRITLIHKNGQETPVAVTLSKKLHGDQILLVAIIKSIAQLDNKIRLLEKQAYTDPLTQIGNRSEFEKYLKTRKRQDKRKTGGSVGILVLDIDDFKSINDQYGHPIGDMVLKIFADVVSESLRENDRLFRIGGEEFVIIAEKLHRSDAHPFAERIREAVEQRPITLPAKTIHITCSIGVCLSDSHDDNLEEMIRKADKAMYRAKDNGKNQTAIAS